MGTHEWLGVFLLVASFLLLFIYRIKLRRERTRHTLRHSLFASHLTSALRRSR